MSKKDFENKFWKLENYIDKSKKESKEWKNGIDKKYNSNSISVNGINFRSQLEKERYEFLSFLKQTNTIKDFFYEDKKYILQEWYMYEWKKIRDITYTPDFKVILNNGDIYIEDTKSIPTSKKESFIIKKKLFIHKYIINGDFKWFKIVFNKDEIYW